MNITEGPITPDSIFFSEALDLTRAKLKEVKRAALRGSVEETKAAFAREVRQSLLGKREEYLSIPYEKAENHVMFDGETEKEAAERILSGTLISVGVPYSFGSLNKIVWTSNPTKNQYREWTWQFSRHHEIKILSHMYVETNDERYAEGAIKLFSSWIKEAVFPGAILGYFTDLWRTIECGIRLGCTWPYSIFALSSSPHFTDSFIVDLYKSIWEHGIRLSVCKTQGNWLIMEMNGLAHIGMLCPEFKHSQEWLEDAITTLQNELGKQIYPDGFQYELSTGYHNVVINNFQRLIESAKVFDVTIPNEILEVLEKAVEMNFKLMMPDGRLPDINDGKRTSVADLMKPKKRIFPKNRHIKWILSNKKEGEMPQYTSCSLPNAGIAIMRTGWSEDSVYALFDSAPFGKAHQHEDKLNLIIYAGNKYIMPEGGNYAYDTSDVRDYVLSTKSHNTAIVDGQGQNRRCNYEWHDEDIKKSSDLKWYSSVSLDIAEGEYNEGYGENGKIKATHRRKVLFFKEDSPFFVVIDSFFSEVPHEYTTLWHIDTEKLKISGEKAISPELSLSFSVGEIESVRGKKDEELFGIVATGDIQGMYKDVWCVKNTVKGNSTVATLISFNDKNLPRISLEGETLNLMYLNGTTRNILTSFPK